MLNGLKLNDQIPEAVPASGDSYEGLPMHFKQFLKDNKMPKLVDDEGEKFLIL